MLEMKAIKQVNNLKKFLRELLWFVAEYADQAKDYNKFDYKQVQISIGRNTIVNETEVIENLVKSSGMISEETKLSKHPYVDDLQKELERLEQESESMKEMFDNSNVNEEIDA